MQLACVEYARNALGLRNAHSSEMNPDTSDPVINIMESQKRKMANKNYGASMRLGNYPCAITPQTQTASLYKEKLINERHRHRFEFNNAYREKFLSTQDFIFSGISPDNKLIEIIELKDHPFFIACQFHPEFKSRPERPHPLFLGFIKASVLGHQQGQSMF
jgi:CTP synthase